ncbi:MAG: MoaD/ThiS family protein [Rhodospirillales bacterium]|nr:MoaD/ThiS family protein [Rhodospirillales bacterium]
MKIRLNFVALDVDSFPGKGLHELDLKEGANVVDALLALGLEEDTFFLTLLNESSVPRTLRNATKLNEGDTLTLFYPIKGG